jgi:hypothetical protein
MEKKKDHFVYHSPNKRFTVVGIVNTLQKTILDHQDNIEVAADIPVSIRFGVSIVKRKDAWSPADKFSAKTGELKALGEAKSKNPAHVITLKPKSNTEKTFLAHAFRIGMSHLQVVEEKIQQEELLYEKGKQLSELLDFYYNKESLRPSRR